MAFEININTKYKYSDNKVKEIATGNSGGVSYIHPAYTALNPTLSGALVIDTITTDTLGSVTGITTRTLTPADIGAESAFTKNTAFNKNFGITIGTVAEGNDSRILNGQTAFGWGNHSGLYSLLSHTHTFAEITTKPTTIGGYGITDFNSLGDTRWSLLAHTHANYVTLDTTQTINGSKIFSNASTSIWGSIRGEALTDLNTDADTLRSVKILTTGFQPLNRPSSGNFFSGVQFSPYDTNNGYKGQLGVSSSGNENAFQLRTADGVGVWSPWRTLYHSGNLTNPITGTGVAGQVAFWNGANSQLGDSGFVWDNVNKRFNLISDSLYNSESNTSFTIRSGSIAGSAKLLIGVDSVTNISYIQSMQQGTGWNKSLVLQGMGGGVGIGITPTEKLEVNGRIRIITIDNLGTSPAEVLVPSATGVVSKRTVAEFKADLGLGTDYMLRSSGALGIDPNTLFNSSAYRINANINNPNATSIFAYLTFGNQSNVTSQIASQAVTGESYIRAYNTLWSSWRKIWDSINLVNPITGTLTPNYIPKATGSSTLADGSIFDNGNIGIGTNLPKKSTFLSRALTLESTGVTGFEVVSNTTTLTALTSALIFSNNQNSISTFQKRIAQISVLTDGSADNGQFQFGTFQGATFNTSLVLKSSGLIGINTIDPTERLDINGTARIRTIANLGTSPTEVLIPSATGVVSKRTLAEFQSDLNVVTLDTTQTITGIKTFNADTVFGNQDLDFVSWANSIKTFSIYTQAQFLHKYRGGAVGALNIGQYDVSGNASIKNTSNAALSLATNSIDRIEIAAIGDVSLKKVDNGVGDFVRIDPTTGKITKRTTAETISDLGITSVPYENRLITTTFNQGLTTGYTLVTPFAYSMLSGSDRTKTQFIIEGNYELTQSLTTSRVLTFAFQISGGATGTTCEVPITLTTNSAVNIEFKFTLTWLSASVMNVYAFITYKDINTGVVTVNTNTGAFGGFFITTGYGANVAAKISNASGTPTLARNHISFNSIFHPLLTP